MCVCMCFGVCTYAFMGWSTHVCVCGLVCACARVCGCELCVRVPRSWEPEKGEASQPRGDQEASRVPGWGPGWEGTLAPWGSHPGALAGESGQSQGHGSRCPPGLRPRARGPRDTSKPLGAWGGPPQGGQPGTGRGPPSLGRLTPLSRRRWGDGVWGEDSTETCWTLRRCCPSQIIPERRLFQTLPTTRRFSAADSQNPDTVDGLAVADPRLRGSAHLRAQGDQRPGDPARPGPQGPVRALRSGDTEATGRAPVSRPGGRRHREGLGRAAGPSATRRPSRPTGLPEPRPPAPERKAVLSDGDAGPWEPEAAQAEGGGRDDPRCPQ